MIGNPGKIVLTENQSANPRYSLAYRRSTSQKIPSKLSYDIISLFIKDQDLILEVNSALFSGLNPNDKEKTIMELINKLQELKIDYRYRKNSYPKKNSLVNFFLSTDQTVLEYELLIYISNQIWTKDDFWEIIPVCGITYHILSKESKGSEFLDHIYAGRLADADIRDHYEMTIFDCFNFGQMGIYTSLSKKEIENYLEELER